MSCCGSRKGDRDETASSKAVNSSAQKPLRTDVYPVASQPIPTPYPVAQPPGVALHHSVPVGRSAPPPLSLSIPMTHGSNRMAAHTHYGVPTIPPPEMAHAYPKAGLVGQYQGSASVAPQTYLHRQPTPTARSPAPSSSASTWHQHYYPSADQQYNPGATYSLASRTPPPPHSTHRPSTHSPPPMPPYHNPASLPPMIIPQPIYGGVSNGGNVPGFAPANSPSSPNTPRSTKSLGSRQGAAAGAVSRRIAETAEGKLAVGIDFGTTFTGVAYGSTRLFAGQIRQILVWPGSYETYRKVPSCIMYTQPTPEVDAEVIAWGLEAKNMTLQPGMIKCEWFKLFLSPESLRSGQPDPRLPPLPAGKNVVDVISDFLRCIWRYAKRQITDEIGSVVDLDAADVLLTVPAAWDAAGCSLMREAAIRAGLVQSSRGGDKNWRDRLQIITEPEAGAIHASTLSTLHHLRPSQTFLICDAGGGTVDTAVYKLMGQLSQLEIAEMCVRSGANAGSLFIDLKFEELVRRILKDHPTHLDAPSIAAFMHSFSETDKLDYHGESDDDNIFRFNCFNVEDGHDPSVGLEWGELTIPGHVLKRQVFDPIIEQVLDLLRFQLSKIPSIRIDALILVGGFAASEYLFTRVQETFGASIAVIARPNDCDVATLRGAARYGLGLSTGRRAVSNVISPRSYIMKVKLPAEAVDRLQRPNFISINDAGMEVCENRLSYLVAKGAVLRKGERLRSRFCKFVKNPRDSIFAAQLYVSDTEELYRYTDDGDATELCRWTVDLAALPRFHQIANSGDGYVEFDLGLSLDSAEVRGVLMTDDGIDCGTATFEFLST